MKKTLGFEGTQKETDPKVKKYLSVEAQDVGTVNRHFGLADDYIPTQVVYGAKNESGVRVKELVNPPTASKFQKLLNEQKEEIYHRSKIPVGQPVLRGHILPEATKKPDFAFGIKTIFGDPATLIVNPPEALSFQEFLFNFIFAKT